jgi:hypothetical protein
MDDRDVIEAHELQRRRTMAAFLWGRQPVARGAHNEAAQGLLIGAALALVILLVVGIVALVGASRSRSQSQQRSAPPVGASATAHHISASDVTG